MVFIAGELAQQLRGLAALAEDLFKKIVSGVGRWLSEPSLGTLAFEPGDYNLVLGTHIVEEENQFPRVAL